MDNGNKECVLGDKIALSTSINSIDANPHDVLQTSNFDNEVINDIPSLSINNDPETHTNGESDVYTGNEPEEFPAADEGNDVSREGPNELDESQEDSDDNSESWKNLPAVSVFRIDFNRLKCMSEELESRPFDSDSSDGEENESTDKESSSVDEVGVSDSHDIREMNMDSTHTRQTIKKLADILYNDYDYNCYYRELEDKEYFICARLYTGNNRILSYLNLKHSEIQHYDTIILLPVLNEQKELQAIYAATSGHASWRHMQLMCDQSFSTEVSPKILHSDGAICHSVSCVVGIYRSKKSVFKDTVNLKNLKIGEVCKNFTASVDKNTNADGVTRKTLLFPDFKKRKDIKSMVGEFYIKFNIELTILQLFTLVEKLELVYVDTTDKYLIQYSKLKRIVLKVSDEVASVLEKELNATISSYVNSRLNEVDPEEENVPIEDMEFSELGDFDVSFKRERIFAEASMFKLKYDKSRQVELEDNPTFAQILKKALDLYQTKPAEANYPFDFEKLELSFASTCRNRIKAKFYDYLRGHVYSSKMGKNYWLVSGDWYFVHKEYLQQVQEDFQDVLKTHLVCKEPPGGLQPPNLFLPWDLKPKDPDQDSKRKRKITYEDIYNKKYTKVANFFVGDKVLTNNVEYFDLAYEDPKSNKTYLYHVKSGFSQTTRVVCSQLKNAAELLTSLRKTNKGNQDEVSELISVLKTALHIEEEKCKSLLGIGFPNRELIYVLGLVPSTTPAEVLKKPFEFTSVDDRIQNRTLQLEKDLRTTLNADDVRDYIKRNKKFKELLVKEFSESCDIVESLIKKLEENKFFCRKEDQLRVTAKLIFTKAISVFDELFPESSKYRKTKLSRHTLIMLTDYITYFPSLGAKMEIIRCKDFLRTQLNNVDDCFKIDEILVTKDPESTNEKIGNVKERLSKYTLAKKPAIERKRNSSGTPKQQNNQMRIEDANTEAIDGISDTQYEESGPDGSVNEASQGINKEGITNETETANRNETNAQQVKRKSKDASESPAKRRK